MNIDFKQFGTWIYVDPDEQSIELLEETLNLDMLCELLRCDSTDMEELGEGASQERQTEWEFNENPCWGPILIVKIGKEDSRLETCDEDDLAVIVPLVKFLD